MNSYKKYWMIDAIYIIRVTKLCEHDSNGVSALANKNAHLHATVCNSVII